MDQNRVQIWIKIILIIMTAYKNKRYFVKIIKNASKIKLSAYLTYLIMMNNYLDICLTCSKKMYHLSRKTNNKSSKSKPRKSNKKIQKLTQKTTFLVNNFSFILRMNYP